MGDDLAIQMKLIMSRVYIVVFAVFYAFQPCVAQNAMFNVGDQLVKKLVNNTDDEISRVVATRYLKPTLKVKNNAGSVRQLNLSENGKMLAVILDDNSIRVWNLELGVQKALVKVAHSSIVQAMVTSDGEYLIYGYKSNQIHVFDLVTKKEISNFNLKTGQLSTLGFNFNETLLFVGDDEGNISVWNWQESLLQETISCHSNAIKSTVVDKKRNSIISASKNALFIYSIKNKTCKQIDIDFQDDIKEILYRQDNQLIYVVLENGVLFKKFLNSDKFSKVEIETGDDFIMSQQGKYGLIIDGGYIKVFELETGRFIQSLQQQKINHNSILFDQKENFIITGDVDGVITFWEIISAKQIVRMFHTKKGWSVIDKSGRFDGSENAIENVFWQAEEFELNLSRFSRQYFEPGLLASYLKNENDFHVSVPLAVEQGITPPPKVEMDFDLTDDQLKSLEPFFIVVIAEDLGGGIGDIQLYHNGKLMPSGALLKKNDQVDEVEGKHILAGVFYVQPVAGPNTFKAMAVNSLGIESESEKITKFFDSDGIRPDLHIFTVGVNKYKEPDFNLEYSVPDALSIIEQFKQQKNIGFNKIHYHTLFNQQATKENIISEFNKLTEISPADVVVFYYAGHGLSFNNEWYLMPYETPRNDENGSYQRIALSSKEIQELLVNIKAQRIMVLIDACYSGAEINSFYKFQHFQRRFSRNLSREVGVTVLAATRQDQLASELSELKHGLFTYVVLKGLDGKADIKPEDKIITAHEIISYSSMIIPLFSRKYINAAQEPTAFALGADFILINKSE